MTVSEADRRVLLERARTVLGDAAARTLMEMIVPAGQERATRADLERSEFALRSDLGRTTAELRGEMQALAAELRGEMQALAAELRGEMRAMEARLRGEMQAMEGRLRGEIGALAAEVHALRDSTASRAFVLGTILSTVLPLYAGMAGIFFLIARG